MLTIKAPEQYLNQPDLLSQAGEHISRYGKRAFIITGQTAFEQVGGTLTASLGEQRIAHQTVTLSGYPTRRIIELFSQQAKDFTADVIIAIGGGRVCDTAKVVGDRLGLPVVAVPTIAATCAAWAAVSILYDEEGDFDAVHLNRRSPVLVLADTRVILAAPARYTHAGVLDTLAKWYETEPNHTPDVHSLTLPQMIHTARLAFDVLSRQARQAIEEGQRGVITQAGLDTVDAIIYLAGQVGTLHDGRYFGGFAHPYYQASTRLAHTRYRLHGDKVALGLLTQFVISGIDYDSFRERVQLFEQFNLALTLEEIGISDDIDADIALLAQETFSELQRLTRLPFASGPQQIETAIRQTDRWVRQIRAAVPHHTAA
ncbi:iron-containing alcohol dehydrogenase family protein [Erwinia sp. S43]|uniref:iron-containing alcohol dehydrogenase family protein n=1 Tax=Erwinia sp. S43 TaxID=2769339 RepID=UPI00190BE2E6|nr:iron-containing alcohol dehydrogenase family protein [Erwinia sp. S43]MBK0031217.1 iron-containing alcohol dehydrogenase family protein [Erwinia sp. S43]